MLAAILNRALAAGILILNEVGLDPGLDHMRCVSNRGNRSHSARWVPNAFCHFYLSVRCALLMVFASEEGQFAASKVFAAVYLHRNANLILSCISSAGALEVSYGLVRTTPDIVKMER